MRNAEIMNQLYHVLTDLKYFIKKTREISLDPHALQDI